MKSSVIVYTQLYSFGGIEYLFVQLAKFLKKKKIKLIIICFENKINFSKYEKNIKLIKLSNNQSVLNKAYDLKKTINKLNHVGRILLYDGKSAAYAHLSKIKNYNIALTDPPSMIKRSRIKTKSVQNIQSKTKEFIYEKFNKYGVQNSQKVFVMSKWNAKEFKKSYKIKPKIIYPGIFGEFNKKGIHVKKLRFKENLNLISISRLVKSKNIDWLLYSLKNLLNENIKNKYFKDIILYIVGHGPETTSLKKITKKYDLINNIKFCGKVSETKKNKLLSNAHINLIPGVQAYGLPALESLRMGVPTVINKESKICEILKNNKMVKITKNNQLNFSESLLTYVEELKKSKIKKYKGDHLPTFKNWAHNLSKSCGWY